LPSRLSFHENFETSGEFTLKPIVVVGSINTDLVVHTTRVPAAGETIRGSSFHTFFGGKGANQAVAVAKLGYPVSMIGKLGRDTFGDELLNGLQQVGVDCHAIERSATPSGIAMITTDDSAQNTIVIVPGANGTMDPDDVLRREDLIRTAGMVLAQLEIPLPVVKCLAERCEQHRVPFMLDPAPATSLSTSLLNRVTWLTPNEVEARQLTGLRADTASAAEPQELAQFLLAAGAQNVVIKLGAKGSFLATADGIRKFIQAFEISARDTTAAGDAYNAAFAVALCEGESIQDAGRFASAAAAISVTRLGAQQSLPPRSEVDRFLERATRG
jgi:ribokinase